MDSNSSESKPFSLHKSHTFSSFTSNSTHKITNFFSALNERRKKSIKSPKNMTLSVLPENVSVGSEDGSVDVTDRSNSPVILRNKGKKINSDINKRLSLPIDLNLPESFVSKQLESPCSLGPISRSSRRQSLSEIGFGRTETYIKLNMLGQGTYATVYKGKSRLTDNIVALKEIRLEHEEGAPCTAIREVSLLKELRHANIVTLHDIIHTENSLTLVFEYLDKDLRQHMDEHEYGLNPYNIKLYLFQLLRGLAYCHKKKILHRDLKPQNLLINEKGELKLGDFGLARAKSVPTKTYSNEVVTLWYRPPDVLLGCTEYSTQIDMWGVGCIFYEMACGKPLFPGSTVEEELNLIFKVIGSPTNASDCWPHLDIPKSKVFHEPESLSLKVPQLNEQGMDLLTHFLMYEAKSRMSAVHAMKHIYFDELGSEIHAIADEESIFSVAGIHLKIEDASQRSTRSKIRKTRQQR